MLSTILEGFTICSYSTLFPFLLNSFTFSYFILIKFLFKKKIRAFFLVFKLHFFVYNLKIV